MIGGLFIYNHKGEVLISRVYRCVIRAGGLGRSGRPRGGAIGKGIGETGRNI
jgi:hypothetical protein